MLGLRTPFGAPVAWAEVRMRSSGEEAHDERGCLVVSGRRLGRATPDPSDDFLLCMVADGAGGRLAQAAFVEAFLASGEIDVLWRLKDAVRAADGRLAARLACTLTALFLAGDGTAYGVSVGETPLRVFPPQLDDGVTGPVQRLGHERSTAIGTGGTLEPGSAVIEEWWPDMDGDGTRTRLEPGTVLLLGGDVDVDTAAGIAVRFDGGQVVASQLVAESGWLVSCVDDQRGLACLSDEHARVSVPGLLRDVLELDRSRWSREGLEQCFTVAGGDGRLAVVASDSDGATVGLAAGGASVETVPGQGVTLRLGSDPLDRGMPIEFQPRAGLTPRPRRRQWLRSLIRRWRSIVLCMGAR